MPVYKKVNIDFFKKWTPEMAYILGFFAADGNMIKGKRGNHYISFYSCDLEIIEGIRKAMGSNHKIGESKLTDRRRKICYQIQIGRKEIYEDLISLGFTPNKAKTLRYPVMQNKFKSHFIRGYFDGDGCISYSTYFPKNRKTPKTNLSTRFTSASKDFLGDLCRDLKISASAKVGSLYDRGTCYVLMYSTLDSYRLYTLLYKNLSSGLYLHRKRKVFESYIKDHAGVA